MHFTTSSQLHLLATTCLLSLSSSSALPRFVPANDNAGDSIESRASPGVGTTSGHYIGHASAQQSNVTEYLGIRYAQPPTGNLRFAAPLAFTSNETFQAAVQPDDCPYVGQNWGSIAGESYQTAGRVMAQESADGYNAMAEDCLKMNIWAPSVGGAKKPVMVFLYGGGFDRGSVNNPAYSGAYMAGKQDVIVVTFNYRVNIFGFSNAPGADTNVAIRDMRLAIEWVRDNIEAFGGDTSHITLFGQSQGAWLISYYAYAFANDSIASSFIQQSGSAFSSVTQNSTVKATKWRNASAAVGCNQTSDAFVLECMRAQSVSTVLAAWAAVQPSGTTLTLPFGPVPDDTLVFSNYTELTLAGKFAHKPVLMGSNDNEAGFYVFRYAGVDQITLNQTRQDEIGYGQFFCPTAVDAAAKSVALAATTNASVYRYDYFGDWPNLRLYPASRAYHTSETSMVFGTMADLSGAPSTPLQVEVSDYLQHAWTTFARDPVGGLKGLGWPSYNQSESTLVRLGYGNESVASYANPASYDAICKKLE